MYLVLQILTYLFPILIGIAFVFKPDMVNRIVGFSRFTGATEHKAKLLIKVIGFFVIVTWIVIIIMSLCK